MILLDNNILFYALIDDGSERSDKAYNWLFTEIEKGTELVVSSVTILAFFRIYTRATLSKALTAKKAGKMISDILMNRNVNILKTPDNHFVNLSKYMQDYNLAGDHTMDAHLAVLALSVSALLATNDNKLLQYKVVQTFNPLHQKSSS